MTQHEVKLGTTIDDDAELSGKELSVDVNMLIDSRALIQGNSRSGKSYLARVLCERARGQVPMIIIDIEGEYASLREKVDAVLVGPDGDIPTDLRSAELLARKLVELRVSAIIDIYELKIHDRREYVRRFLDSLMSLPKELWGPLLVVVDEAHKLCPEKGQGESVATQSVIDLMSQGGKRQYCGVLITQRFSKLHNDAIAEANNVFIGRTWMDTDQVRAGKYLGMSPAERQMLRDIPQGEFYAFGPALSLSGVTRFKSDRATTKVPKVGERHKLEPPKASTAIKHIIEKIGDLPEVAEAEARDIAAVREQAKKRETELQGQVAELKRELAAAAKPVEVPKEIHVFPDEKLQALEEKIDEYFKPFAAAVDALSTTQATAKDIEQMVLDLKKAIPAADEDDGGLFIPTRVPMAQVRPAPGEVYLPPSISPHTGSRIVNTTVAGIDGSETGKSSPDCEQRILDTLRSFEAIGQPHIKRNSLAAYIGYAPGTKVFTYAMSALRTAGHIEASGGSVQLTASGRAQANQPAALPNHAAFLAAWMAKFNVAEKLIVKNLIAARPMPVKRSELAALCGYAESTKAFTYGISNLKSLGVVGTATGTVHLTGMLFPEGLV